MEIFKIIAVGLLTCFLSIIIKQIKPEFHLIVLLAGSLTILVLLLKQFTSIIDYFALIINKTNIDTSLFVVILNAIIGTIISSGLSFHILVNLFLIKLKNFFISISFLI